MKRCGFVAKIYRESTNKSNSRLTPTFHGRQQGIASNSRSCTHISPLPIYALSSSRTRQRVLFEGLHELSARGNEREISVIRLAKETDMKSGPHSCRRNFRIICDGSTQTARSRERNLRESWRSAAERAGVQRGEGGGGKDCRRSGANRKEAEDEGSVEEGRRLRRHEMARVLNYACNMVNYFKPSFYGGDMHERRKEKER